MNTGIYEVLKENFRNFEGVVHNIDECLTAQL